jgi:hypothetical protein
VLRPMKLNATNGAEAGQLSKRKGARNPTPRKSP